MKNTSRLDGPASRFFNAACLLLTLFSGLLGLPPTGAAAEPLRLMAFGDSLTAGYGLPDEEGFTARLQNALDERGYEIEVINAGVSGDTTTGGFDRLDWALSDEPDYLILELGANDGLRAIDPAVTRANLDAMLDMLAENGVATLLTGMLAPPNLGRDYGDAFNAIYPDLAATHGVPFYPFFLDGVAADSALNQRDGIHPNAEGVAIIVERMMPYLVDMIGPPPKNAQTGQFLQPSGGYREQAHG